MKQTTSKKTRAMGVLGRSVLELCVLVGAATALANGCGGTVVDDSRHGTGDLDGGAGGGIKDPSAAYCGNNRVDPGEACDGYDLNGMTCASVTLGQYQSGTLVCGSDCQFITSKCMSTGVGAGGMPYPGTGGIYIGAGGGPPYGGYTGYGGYPGVSEAGPPPPPTCPPGVVPDPSNPYLCSDAGAAACRTWTDRQLPQAPVGDTSCGTTCGCLACPTELSNCLADPACATIERCVVVNGCYDATMCGPQCWSLVTGGTSSAAFNKALEFDKCWESAGCDFQCTSVAADASFSGRSPK